MNRRHSHAGEHVRQGVERGKALKDAHGVVRAQHRHRGPESNPVRSSGDGGEHDVGTGDRKIFAMMFAEADDVDTDTVGEHGLVDHLPDDLRR